MSPYAILAAGVAVLLALIGKLRSSGSSSKLRSSGSSSKLPPSPPSLPFLGHLHHLMGGQPPHRSLSSLQARHGNPSGPLLLQLGRRRTLVVSTAAAAADLYKNHDIAFGARPPNAAVDKLSFGADNVSFAFAPYGDPWRRGKKMAVVHLLSHRRADSFAPVRAAEAASLVATVARAAEAGEAVELRGHLYAYGNAVITRAATGTAGASAERLKQLLANSAALMSGLQEEDVLPGAAAKVVRWATGLEKKLDREVQGWDEFLSGIVAEHKEKRKKKRDNVGAGDEDEDEDFLDVLLRLRDEGTAGFELTDDRIKCIAKDMIAAGTETSSVTLEWAMVELMRNPGTMAKLQDEIARVADGKPAIEEKDLAKMEYLKAVVKEVFRLHPPAPLLIPRESTMAAVAQGYEIPAKTALFINAWAIGRDPAAWGDAAEEFRPERFMAGGGDSASVDVKGNDYGLIPFGACRRVCPGISFAMPALEMALASLVRSFDWELEGPLDDMRETPGLTTPPMPPLRLVPKCKTL